MAGASGEVNIHRMRNARVRDIASGNLRLHVLDRDESEVLTSTRHPPLRRDCAAHPDISSVLITLERKSAH